MALVSDIASEAREASLKSVTPESWSLQKENAFYGGVLAVYRTLARLSDDTQEDVVIRALHIYLQKTPAQKRFLALILDRIRQRQRLLQDAHAMAVLLEQLDIRINDARTEPKGLVDRLRRFVTQI
jgi:hypothetical protein